MRFTEDEQEPGPAPASEAEPRLLTRPDRQPSPEPPRKARPATTARHRQAPAESGLRTFARRLARRRAQASAARPGTRQRTPKARTARLGLWAGLGAGAALLLLLAVGAAALFFRHAMHAALPQLDGSLQVNGLHAPVTVTRDPQGVPVITASRLDDLLEAQGYTTAGDRLWQMDSLRRHAAGELAEVLGSSLVEHDRRQRFLQLRAAADRAVAQLPPDQLSQLEAYARGVNAYIDTHSGALPIEFRLLAYTPAHWTPRDSLLVSLAMWQDLSTEFPRKLEREALATHLPANLLTDLYPVGSWRDVPPAAQGRDLTTPHIVEQIPLDPSQSRVEPAAAAGPSPVQMAAVTDALMGGAPCDGCRSGSNNWVVSGTHTASGAPMVANDMHLGLNIPDVWYEASLHATLADQPGATGRLDVTGFTLPGVPFVIVGRNREVAWGVTNLGADVQDLRVEHLRGAGDSTEYERADGSWASAGHQREVIRVRGALNTTLDVLTTTHPGATGEMQTPVISPLYPGEQRALSLAWTAYDPHAVNSPFLAVNIASSGDALVTAFKDFGGPSLNLVWADAAGHIGYHAVGMVPVRGAAVQHPRAEQAPIVEPGTLPPDEGSQEPAAAPDAAEPEGAGSAEPQAALHMQQPHLVLSAFVRPVRHPRAAPTAQRRVPTAQRRGPTRTRAAAAHPVPVRGRRQRAAAAAPAAAPVAAAEAPLPAPPPLITYTIGSALSPGPVDALDSTQAWTAYVPYESLPSVVDPTNGLLATANARIAPDDYPYALSLDWSDPFRAERLVHLLSRRTGLKPEDMLAMQTDVYSDVNRAFAQRLAYAVDHAGKDTLGSRADRLHSAANLLRAWDGEMRVDSPAAAMVSVTRRALWDALLVPQIAHHDSIGPDHARTLATLYTWGEKSTALELLVQHRPARWLPHPYKNWNDLLAGTLDAALTAEHAPGNLDHWQYGEIHRIEITHPLFGTHRWLSRLIGARPGTGAQPAPGDATTVDAIGAHFGPSERFVADLSSPEAALGNITTGQSGNPRSPWYLDQFRPWLAGHSFALPGTNTATTHTLTLLP